MRNKSVLTLSLNKKEVLSVAPEKVSPKGCEFSCDQRQSLLLNEENGYHGRYKKFQLRLGLFFDSTSHSSVITTDCQVASIRRESEDVFKVIVSFIDLSLEACRLIYSFLSAYNASTKFAIESCLESTAVLDDKAD